MSHNTWIHKGVRAVLVRPLARTRVTPNHLTGLRMATGVAAAACLAVGPDMWRWIGAGIFLVSLVLDRADGELARLTGKTTPWGHTYDLRADAVSNVVIFIGLGVGLRGGDFGPWAILMGTAAGVAVGLSMWLVIRMEQMGKLAVSDMGGANMFDPDDAMFVIPVALWFGWAEPLLVAALIGAPAFVLFVFLWRPRRPSTTLQSQQTAKAPKGIDNRPDSRSDE